MTPPFSPPVAATPESETGTTRGWLLLILIALLSYFSVSQIQPPRAVPENAPPSEFSSGRAMKHLREITRRPHPTGSQEHKRVREYIFNELSALGVEVEVQRATVVQEAEGFWRARPVAAASVENVVARLRGASNTKAVMLAAHYDSVPHAPGATDDGAGVVALLETLRALKSAAPLKNDVIFLFTDGEELGLLGAKAFVEEHAWAKDVGLVLNFEGRGRGGPVLMFETSEGNHGIVEEFARAETPRPVVANSLMYALYKRLPNDTDMSVFKNAGLEGFNFAYADGIHHYHTALDTADELDERSLQHHGAYALSLARHFGDSNLAPEDTTPGDSVYFDLFGSALVSYSVRWVLPLTILTTLAFVAALAFALRQRSVRLSGVIAGFFALLACVALAFSASAVVWWALKKLHGGFASLPSRDPYNGSVYKFAFVFLTVAIASALYIKFRRKAGGLSLAFGASLLWLTLLWLTTLALPAGSYVFAWPLLFGTLALAVVSRLGGGANRLAWKRYAATALCIVPLVVLVAPVIYMLFIMLGLSAPAIISVPLVFALGLILPTSGLLAQRRAWTLPAAACALAVVLFAAGLATAGFDAKRRKVNSVFYALNADTGQAVWASSDAAPDDWTKQFFPDGGRERESVAWALPWLTFPIMRGDAPVDASLAAPQLEILDGRTEGDLRIVRARVSTPRRAALVVVSAGSETEVLGASVSGQRLDKNFPRTVRYAPFADGRVENPLRLAYAAPPSEGFEILFELRAGRPLKLGVTDVTYELPRTGTVSYTARPPHMMPAPNFLASDATLVSKSFIIE